MGGLFRRFCSKFSESSPCLLWQQCSCSTAQQPGELSENILQNLSEQVEPGTYLFVISHDSIFGGRLKYVIFQLCLLCATPTQFCPKSDSVIQRAIKATLPGLIRIPKMAKKITPRITQMIFKLMNCLPELSMALCRSAQVISAGTMLPATIVLSINSPYLEPGRARSRRKSSPAEGIGNIRCRNEFGRIYYFAASVTIGELARTA